MSVLRMIDAQDVVTRCVAVSSFVDHLTIADIDVWSMIKVLNAYEKEGFDMMLKAFNEPKYLETLTGLDKLYEEGQAALDNVDWDVDEGGEGSGDDF